MKRLDSGENIELEKIVTSELYFLDLALKNNGGFITQLFYIALILDEIVSSDSTCDIVSVSDIIAMLVTHELTIVNDKNKTVVKHLEAFANAWMVAEEKLKNVVKNRVE